VRSFATLSPVTGGYFGKLGVNRARLVWIVATRRQLEQWEAIVSRVLRDSMAGRRVEDWSWWSAEIERHFLLVAARNLFRALDLAPTSSVSVDPILRAELIEGRDLQEHWPDNMPVFNVTPRPAEPGHRSGKSFAARNPKSGPYDAIGWSNKTGALLLPNVSAPALHELLDAVEAEVLASDETLGRFVPPRALSPWVREKGEWWPKADDG
jgi:hypothetical protein